MDIANQIRALTMSIFITCEEIGYSLEDRSIQKCL